MSEKSQAARLALQRFVQANFTGPPLDKTESEPQEILDAPPESLAYGQIHHLALHPELLIYAVHNLENDPIWLARALVVYQSVLYEHSSPIQEKIFQLYSETNIQAFSTDKAELMAEVARAHLVYNDTKSASEWLAKAVAASGLVHVLTGVFGKRTKFQKHETSQLVCLAKSSQDSNLEHKHAGPKHVDLESQLLLETPTLSQADESLPQELASLDPNNQPPLKDIDNAILILESTILGENNPTKESTVVEQQLAFISRVIANPSNTVCWSISSRALWLRSVLEAQSSHKIERGALQMQALVEESGYAAQRFLTEAGRSQEADAAQRLHGFHMIPPQPKWILDTQLAERYMALGAVKSAIEIYERLELFADAALCHAATGFKNRGIEMMDKYLTENPGDARAWAIKGDILVDPKCWEKAWELAKYTKAKLSLSRYYFSPPKGVERDAAMAASHIEEALLKDYLNVNAWFYLGCICLEQTNFHRAAEAFTRCVAIDDSDCRSWSNLGAALLQLDKPQQALHALRQAIRADLNQEPDWRVWSNLIVVASQLGRWHDVIEGLNRLLDSRKEKLDKFVNPALLGQVVDALTSQEFEECEERTREALVDLITRRLPEVITTSAGLWRLVSKVYLWQQKPWSALETLEKAFRTAGTNLEIQDSTESWKHAVLSTKELVNGYRELGDLPGRIEGSKVCPNWQFKARSAIRSVLGKGRLNYETTSEYEELQALKESVA